MPWYSLAVRPINMARSQQVRAASPHTSKWGMKRLLSKPATKAAALENILHRAEQNPALVAHALLSEKTTLADKVLLINTLIALPEFQKQTAQFNNPSEMPTPPKFFSWLAKQPQPIVDQIHQLWCHFDRVQPGELVGLVAMDTPPTTEGAQNAFTVNSNLKVIYSFEYTAGTDARDPKNTIDNTHQINGYEIGQKDFYLIRQPITSYQWTRNDFFRVFPQPMWNIKLLTSIITEGFFSRLEVSKFRASQETRDTVQSFFAQNRPFTITINRSSGAEGVTIEVSYLLASASGF